ncbi:HPr family phosphocarrier protein [Paenibacillus sp. S-38]|uniref:HPr family phosphocarrier protein n=1 Tax=Paenibacillus sp. S-38 TaxID=3416710 RepID=UPI003CE8DF12
MPLRVHDVTVPEDLQPDHLQRIAQQASLFRSDIKIKFENERIQLDAKSLLGMMMLPMRRGTRVTVLAQGNDEEEALERIASLLERQEWNS